MVIKMTEKQKIIVIVGPTGVGKTALSIELAKQLNGEIVNGDSLQVYRTLDIGTAKITPEEMQNVPHYLLDICEVQEEYTASDFKQMASQAIHSISSQQKIPIVIGGTGLYIEGLLFDFHFSGEGSNDEAYRQQLEQELAERGPQAMWEQLQELDPKSASVIHVNNTRRVIRALEVIHATGRLFSENDQSQRSAVYDAFIIGLTTERSVLYERINQRVDLMLEAGLEQEAFQLYEQVKGMDVQSIRGIGYKEWIPYFEAEQSKEAIIETIKQNSRRYAKRQLTWFRNRTPNVHWYDLVAQSSQLMKIVKDCQQFIIGGEINGEA